MAQKIEKDQISLTSSVDQIKFHYLRAKGHLFSYLWNRFKWHKYPPLRIVSHFPLHVDVEISTHCNMKCPMCYRRTEKFTESVKQQFMGNEIFIKVIKECAQHRIFSIRLSLRGESFIHPNIFEFIKIAKEAGIKEVSSLTNGLALTPEKFEKLVQLKFDWLTISFDGLGSMYESIRKPALFKESFEKIKEYHQIKKRYNSSKPVIRIQTIWPAIKEDPEEFHKTFYPYVDSIMSNPLIDFLRKDENIEYNENYKCTYLYQRLFVGSDGRVLLCPCDEYGDYIIGDVREDSIYDIWHCKKLYEARNWFRKKTKKWWEYAPCKYCCYPRKKERVEPVLIGGHKVNVEKYINRSDDISIRNG